MLQIRELCPVSGQESGKSTLNVTPVASGSTMITIKDATTGTAVKVFVTVD